MIALWRAPFRGVRARWPLLALAVLLLSAVGSLVAPAGLDVNPGQRSQGWSMLHPLGTDHLGRDIALRCLQATRAFVGPGLMGVLLALGLGIPTGAAAGWDRSPLRRPAQALIDAASAIPGVVVVLLVAATWGSGPLAWAVGSGVAAAPGIAELVRGRLERLVVTSHVDAARAHGFSEAYVLWVHGVWLGAGRSLARRAVELVGVFAALECTLSYLGALGVPEPTPSWGNMIAFEWGYPIGLSTLAPAALLWATAALTSRAGGMFAEDST